jgi:hypothetical protein
MPLALRKSRRDTGCIGNGSYAEHACALPEREINTAEDTPVRALGKLLFAKIPATVHQRAVFCAIAER